MSEAQGTIAFASSDTYAAKADYPKAIVLGIGYFAISAIWAVYNAFVPLLLANNYHLSSALIGFFMALDNLAVLLIQPLTGTWSDRLRSPLGRRLPFLMIGAPVAALAFGLIPLVDIFPLFSACCIAFLLSMAFWRTPFTALIADVTPSAYRSQVNGIINSIGVLGAFIAFLAGAALYRQNRAFPYWSSSGIIFLALLLVVFLIKEPRINRSRVDHPSLLNNLQLILHEPDRSTLRLFLAIFCWFVSNNTIDAFISLYAVNYLKMGQTAGASLLGFFTLSYILFAVPAGYLGSRFGRRTSILIGISIMGLCGLAQYLFPAPILTRELTRVSVFGTVPVIGLTMMLSGIGWTLVNVNSLPMVMDSTGDLNMGAYMGLFFLFSTLGAIIGPIVNGWIIHLTNYGVTMLVGPFFMLAAFILMIGVHHGEAINHR